MSRYGSGARGLAVSGVLALVVVLAPGMAIAQGTRAPASSSGAQEAVATAEPGETGQRGGPTDAVELAAFLDGLMAAHMAEKDIAGAVVSVVRDGSILLARGYGYADVEERKPVDPGQTLFRIGSVSKLFTWMAVMQLVEQGELDLHEDVNTYLDFEVPATFDEPITLYHLLTHTPGFEERGTGLFSDGDRRTWLAEDMPARVNPPGMFSSYSNYGTAMAGYIVERVTGQSWEEYIDQHLLEPLGMENTTGRQPLPDHLEDQMSVGYANEGGRLVARDFEILIPAAPAGSVSSTAVDMARFMLANLQGGELDGVRVLGDSTLQLMHERTFGHDERLNGFGLGFYEKTANGVRVIGHGGDTQWFHTDMALFPEEDLGVFVSYNTQAGGELSFGPFLELFLDHYYPVDRTVASAEQVDASAYTGTYRSTRSSFTTYEKVMGLVGPLKVAEGEDGGLVLEGLGDRMRLVPAGAGLFREANGPVQAAFQLDDDGRASHLFLGNIPMMAMERVAWYEEPGLHQLLLGLSVLVFLSVLLLVPFRYALQRKFAEVAPLQGPERTARWAAFAVALLNLVGLVGIAASLGMESLLHGDMGGLKVALLFPFLGAILTLALVWFTVQAWRKGFWGRGGRIHYTVVTAFAVLFVWFLSYWNILGWQFG
ncbi:MAG TPA: serine hydrolase domain-containing protein [Longimicrobiales bacterium]|nr:serine hydrolase domain-containing protein [Longimicrobiales bacterium]